MPTTFDVICLGKLPDMDSKEGNFNSEDASKLEGLVFGGPGDALVNYVQELTPGSKNFSQGNSSAYDQNGSVTETFRINGGPEQVFDGTALFDATLTYSDGTTAQITAVIFQDEHGNSYLAPEKSQNADSDAMEAKPILSLRLDCVAVDKNIGGLSANRYDTEFVTCYCPGTRIATPGGDTLIEDLQTGDLVLTQDRGAQAIDWIGRSAVLAMGNLAPVRIAKGALGQGLPAQDLSVSQQHRMVLRSDRVRASFGLSEIMVPAKKLVGLPGITLEPGARLVRYFHVLLPRHEVLLANGAPSESLYLGPMLDQAVGAAARAELDSLFPDLALRRSGSPARFLPRGAARKRFLAACARHPDQPLVAPIPIAPPQDRMKRAGRLCKRPAPNFALDLSY